MYGAGRSGASTHANAEEKPPMYERSGHAVWGLFSTLAMRIYGATPNCQYRYKTLRLATKPKYLQGTRAFALRVESLIKSKRELDKKEYQ